MAAPNEVDEAAAKAFAAANNRSQSWGGALRDFLCFFYYQKLPSVGDRQLSLRGLLLTLLRASIFVALASTPIWRGIGKADFEFSAADGWRISIVALLLLSGWGLDRMLAKKARSSLAEKLETDASVYLADTLRRINELSGDTNTSSKEELTALFRDILKCIEYKVRLYLHKSDKYYFNVSLITFSDNGNVASVRARSNQKRKSVDNLDARKTAAYYMAESQRVKIINDFRRQKIFPNRGLSASDAPYRSILFLPLEPIIISVDEESKQVCQAVVTIDSEKPYEFWSVTDTNLEIQMRPFLDELRMALSGQKCGVPITKPGIGSLG